jgi:hypothetical protein
MTTKPLKRLILNEALPHGLFAVRGESGALWVLDWQGSRYGESRGIRIRGREGNVGYDDNRWLYLARMAAINPDNPHDDRAWEIRTGWRHRWEQTYENGQYRQTACTSIESVTLGQVEGWLEEALTAPDRPISPAMDPAEQVPPAFRRLLGLDDPPHPATEPDDEQGDGDDS